MLGSYLGSQLVCYENNVVSFGMLTLVAQMFRLLIRCTHENDMSRIVRKPDFCLGENKGAFVFATRIVQFLFYLNPKFQASSSFLSLYRPVCVGPGRKPRRPVFSRRGSYEKHFVCIICQYQKMFFHED